MTGKDLLRTSPQGLATIGGLLLLLAALLLYPPWILKGLRRAAFEGDVKQSQEAVMELARIGDAEAVRTLCEVFEASRNDDTRELARTLLLHLGRMLPTYPPSPVPQQPVEPLVRLGGRLVLLLDGRIEDRVPEHLLVALSTRLGLPVVIETCPVSFAAAPKNQAGASDAEVIVNSTALHVVGEVGRALVLTRRELWATGRPWVPGMAHGFGATAVVSVGALDPAREGGADDWPRYARRLENVSVQALGHTLIKTDQNCARADCVMRRVASPEELDSLASGFCLVCGALVRDGIRRIGYGGGAR